MNRIESSPADGTTLREIENDSYTAREHQKTMAMTATLFLPLKLQVDET